MATAEEPLLSCEGVSKYFGAMAAVKNLSCEIKRGEIFGIGGPNGAGKTTLFEVISGVARADAGSIIFDGRAIARRRPDAICKLGLARVFQANAAFESLTVYENVTLGAVYGYGQAGLLPLRILPDARARVKEALEFVGMENKTGRIASQLSVVERKRLMVASALASTPKLLLLDEPVGGLNHQEIEDMMALVRRVAARGVCIVLIEHVMRFMVALATRIMIMHHGEKIFEGSPAELPKDRTVVNVYLGSAAASRIAGYLRGE